MAAAWSVYGLNTATTEKQCHRTWLTRLQSCTHLAARQYGGHAQHDTAGLAAKADTTRPTQLPTPTRLSRCPNAMAEARSSLSRCLFMADTGRMVDTVSAHASHA